ncbi:MFS transporter [Actinomycetospora sp. TBRC 11914]|uniref:MFS transporter n=1 Tax=Actinomycetospora sp. TBRC 11914 TaxID=2729387 RepID=UPI00145C836F|nr:MFS transporter [Actinomycetospora sp. TBRC 11914]NMO92589.1 MFS transporter [Actinomycetospora sp. TBRC 11914]
MVRLPSDVRGRALAALCVTEITSWGSLYYAFPVLLGPISAQTGWSATATVGAFSTGAVVSALAGIGVGRLIDARGPRPVMTTGSILGVAALLAVAAAPSLPWFYLAWALAGVAQAATFYPPAFAAITGWYGEDRLRPLTTVTLVAGFASTVFAPLTAALVSHLTWRGSYVVLALLLGVVTIPLHLLLLTPPWRPAGRSEVEGADVVRARSVVRSARFVALAVVMTASGFALYAATINLVPLLVARGASLSTAAVGLGLVGVGQVSGRLVFGPLARATSPGGRVALVVVVGGVGVAVLGLLPGPVALLVAVAVAAGAARGLHTLLQASAVSDRWGVASFGRINGVFSAPTTVAVALAPAGGVVLAGLVGGFGAAFVVLGAVAVVVGVVAVRL